MRFVEAFEDVRNFLGVDSLASVFDRKHDVGTVGSARNLYATAVGRKFSGINQQIADRSFDLWDIN